jgi:hypothetical protein
MSSRQAASSSGGVPARVVTAVLMLISGLIRFTFDESSGATGIALANPIDLAR